MFANKYVSFLEKEIESLKVINEQLRESNYKLQAALVAKESPMAYEHYNLDTPQDKKAREDYLNTQKLLQRYAQEIEKPLFESADEAIEMFTKGIGPPKSRALHDNSES